MTAQLPPINCTIEQDRQVRQNASLAGMTISEWIRSQALQSPEAQP
jgi:hypothetical protein